MCQEKREEVNDLTEEEILTATEAKRKYQRDYMKKWREKNRERVKEANLKYWLRRAVREAKEADEQKEVQDHAE